MVRAWVVVAAFVAVVGLGFVAPAAAQDGEPAVTVVDDGEDAQPATQIVRDDDTSSTVHRIRRDLVLVAGVTTAGLVVYVWHTNPTRRLRIAAARADAGADTASDD